MYRHVDWTAVIGIDAGGSHARSEAVLARDRYAARVSPMIRMRLDVSKPIAIEPLRRHLAFGVRYG
jgi:hypothetical protein